MQASLTRYRVGKLSVPSTMTSKSLKSSSALALESREVYHVKVNQTEFADASGGKIQTEWRAEAASADEQHLGILQFELPLHANFRHDEVAAVAQNLFVGKARCRF